MGFAEFEEKEFEKPLYNQLENGKCDVWTPGQCFEAHIGFDYSGNIGSYEFWDRFGGYMPKGVILSDYNMGYILKKIKKQRRLPTFSLNLFIQAKRPYIHSGIFSKSVFDIKHYSFDINQRQQKILDRLDHKLHHRALLVYASPVFGTYEELYKYTQDGIIISNTSFPKVSDLSGHTQWYYCDANSGIAHSEPEEQKTRNILELIEDFKHGNNYTYVGSFYENLMSLSKTIIDTLEDLKKDVQVDFCFKQIREMQNLYEYQQRLYRKIYHEINHHEYIEDSYMVFYAFSVVTIFCDVFNLDWFVL